MSTVLSYVVKLKNDLFSVAEETPINVSLNSDKKKKKIRKDSRNIEENTGRINFIKISKPIGNLLITYYSFNSSKNKQ